MISLGDPQVFPPSFGIFSRFGDDLPAILAGDVGFNMYLISSGSVILCSSDLQEVGQELGQYGYMVCIYIYIER